MKKIISFLLIIGGCSQPDKTTVKDWDDHTHDEKVSLANLSSSLLKSTNDDLIEIVLHYPFLIDLYAFSSYESGYNQMFDHFNGMQELSKRENSSAKSLKKYKDLNDGQTFEKMSLEIIITVGMKDKMNKEERNEVIS